jgi:hypothetical protein
MFQNIFPLLEWKHQKSDIDDTGSSELAAESSSRIEGSQFGYVQSPI